MTSTGCLVLALTATTDFLPLQQIHFVNVNGLLITEEGDQNAQANGGLGCGVGDYKDGEHLTVQSAPQTGERYQVQVHGIKNQLDRHQHDDHVTAGEHTDHAQQEQGGAQHKVV